MAFLTLSTFIAQAFVMLYLMPRQLMKQDEHDHGSPEAFASINNVSETEE